jgi:hypothetical protein
MRRLCWFSCGAPSAVAAKLTVATRPDVDVVYCRVEEEHPDNMRFLNECARWIMREITVIGNADYHYSIYEVFRRTRFLNGFNGAPCTRLLKRVPRELYSRTDDIHVLGFTAEEEHRLADFQEAFPDLRVECPLIERNLWKNDCLGMIADAGIEIPMMYKLGFTNNNCRGCVKGKAGHWNLVRIHFPEYFDRMAKMQRRLNYTPITLNGERVFLDELPPDAGRDQVEPKIDCSIMCLLAKQEYGG